MGCGAGVRVCRDADTLRQQRAKVAAEAEKQEALMALAAVCALLSKAAWR